MNIETLPAAVRHHQKTPRNIVIVPRVLSHIVRFEYRLMRKRGIDAINARSSIVCLLIVGQNARQGNAHA